MKIEEYSFRQLHHNYVLIKDVGDRFHMYNTEFQCIEGDNSLLTYGYIDHSAGLTFEILCFAKKSENGGIELRPGNDNTSFKIRYDGMLGEIEVIPYDIRLMEFQAKVDMIDKGYRGSYELELIRKHTPIDADRDKQFPDDVCAYLIKSGVRSEKIWVRTQTIMDGKVAGVLMNEPHSAAFGLKRGDVVKLVSVPVQGGMVTVIETPDIYG